MFDKRDVKILLSLVNTKINHSERSRLNRLAKGVVTPKGHMCKRLESIKAQLERLLKDGKQH